jgi:type II secretory pathway component PulF
MIEAGLGAPEAFEILVEQSSGRMKPMLKTVLIRLSSGERLSEALSHTQGIFSRVFLSAVEAGERSGTLSQNLSHVAAQLEQDLSLKRHIQGALLYPAIVVFATFLLGLLLATFVLPELASVFASLHTQLPWSTRALLWFAQLFADHGSWLSPLVLLCLFGLVVLLRQRFLFPYTHFILLRLPGFGVFFHDSARAYVCRGMGTLLRSGIPLQEALEIQSQAMENYYYRQSLSLMVEQIASGEGFGKVLERYPKLYPLLMQRMVAVGERAGGLDEIFFFLARFYEERVSLRAKNLSSIIEPLLLLAIGLGVAFVALSIFTPIYSITGSLSL